MLDLLFWPFLAILIIAVIHAYLGLHVVKRGVIFVDLAMAQMAALGTTFGFILGLHPNQLPIFFVGLGFTMLGAAIFAILKFEKRQVPQEAIIGITYVVSAAMMLLLLSKLAEGAEHIDNLLVGSILFVTPIEVLKIFLPYLVIGFILTLFHQKFSSLSQAYTESRHLDRKENLLNFLFYVIFGLVVTLSVKIAGIFLVFSFLIIPAVIAKMFTRNFKSEIILATSFSIFGSVTGLWASVILDIPTGASIVVSLGLMLVFASGYKVARN
ncbi:MAG: metal ABC transporter permease [Candidatus Marinimicrobia bacterium]|nr:metal ABC transporter permease [Candidatus Neomarinimicrobiota bacterium]